jgi:hypothetical protein
VGNERMAIQHGLPGVLGWQQSAEEELGCLRRNRATPLTPMAKALGKRKRRDRPVILFTSEVSASRSAFAQRHGESPHGR